MEKCKLKPATSGISLVTPCIRITSTIPIALEQPLDSSPSIWVTVTPLLFYAATPATPAAGSVLRFSLADLLAVKSIPALIGYQTELRTRILQQQSL